MTVFRGKFLDYINKAVENGMITLPDSMTIQQWKNLKNKLGRTKWNVHIRERYDHGQGVLIYLARYIRGGAISNKRIISFTNHEVTFNYRNSDRSKKGIITLASGQFIQRYFLHVPHPYKKVVRYYGIYASAVKHELTICRNISGQGEVKEPEVIDWQSYCYKKGKYHPGRCPVCGAVLIQLMDIPGIPLYHYREAIKNVA